MGIKDLLEAVFNRYHRVEFIGDDPVGFPRRYSDLRDREVVSLIAAFMAFGRVEQIRTKTEMILSLFGDSPFGLLMNGDADGLALKIGDFRHRFMNAQILVALLKGLSSMIREWGSVGSCFRHCWDRSEGDLLRALSIFRRSLASSFEDWGMIMPDPERGSACKRWLLFMRWMVRKDDVDPGGWGFIPPSSLLVPLDVHLHRVAIRLGFTRRKSGDMRTVLEITEALKGYDPQDPVRYDFSLTRWSMAGFPPVEIEEQ